MVKTVLFVHGTGVRKLSYESSAARIAKGLHSINPGIRLEPCLWGDAHGARLGMNGASIPEFKAPVAAVSEETQMEALWELLAQDALFELRELAASRKPGGLVAPHDKIDKAKLLTQLAALETNATLLTRIQERALTAQWQQAVRAVASSQAAKDAVEAASRVDATLRLGLSRAVVASLQARLLEDNMAVLPAPLRDELVKKGVDEFGGGELNLFTDWVTSKLKGFGLRWATAKAKRERDALYTAAAPTAGDVLLYQARGASIRDFIADRVDQCGDDVVIFAHSLGGIACVDLLIERSLPQVKALVTVGSQAPFMYEIGALTSLAYGEQIPSHFPPKWINFYDCNDLLSYMASKVFAGRATDHEVRSGLPFPMSHSAYWDMPELWQTLAPHLK